MKPEWHILNLGAGVQSTALYLMFMQGVLTPRLDYAIFADTAEEPEDVYAHLEWLKSLRSTSILVRMKGRLGEHLKTGTNSTGGRCASIPAFTLNGQTTGQVRRQCSKEYKIEVIDRTIRRDILQMRPRQRIPKGVHVHSYIGISLDESGRAARMDRNNPAPKWMTRHFPLIDNFMTRANCLEWLEKYGKVPHQVPRSACVFCPYHSDAEWLRIKANENDWARAVEIDEALRVSGNVVNRKMNGQMFLHRQCLPLVQIQFNDKLTPRQAQSTINFAAECMGVCGV